MDKWEKLIIIVVIIAIIGGLGYYFGYYKKNNQKVLEYSSAKISADLGNVFYQDFKAFKQYTKKAGLTKVTKNYQGNDPLVIYGEEFFKTHKIATISIYQDDTRDYITSLDDIVYNDTKTEATIYYTARSSTYTGSYSSSWFYVMYVELEGTVTKVNYINNASATN